MDAFSSTIAIAAALCPPSWKSREMRSTMECTVGAASSQSEKVLLPRPSGQAPIRMMVPPSLTACFALSSAFCVWYRLASFGAPPEYPAK